MRTLFAVGLILILWPLAFSQETRWMPGKPVSKTMPGDKLLGKGPWLSAGEQERLRAMWPKDVEWIDGLKFYKRTEYSQRIVEYVNSGRDNGPSNIAFHHNSDDGGSANPNRLFPIAVNGGLHNSTGWMSNVAVKLPAGRTIKTWTQDVKIASGPMLPAHKWSFPVGTVFIDMLSLDGEVFELRKRGKSKDGWEPGVMWRGGTKPANYVNAGKACAECHDHAGASKQYGILWRGNDETFSAPILAEGTVNFDYTHWPLENGRR